MAIPPVIAVGFTRSEEQERGGLLFRLCVQDLRATVFWVQSHKLTSNCALDLSRPFRLIGNGSCPFGTRPSRSCLSRSGRANFPGPGGRTWALCLGAVPNCRMAENWAVGSDSPGHWGQVDEQHVSRANTTHLGGGGGGGLASNSGLDGCLCTNELC